MFEAHTGVGGAELPVDALLGDVAGLRPRGDLRVTRPASPCAGTGPGASGRSVPVRPCGASCRAGA